MNLLDVADVMEECPIRLMSATQSRAYREHKVICIRALLSLCFVLCNVAMAVNVRTQLHRFIYILMKRIKTELFGFAFPVLKRQAFIRWYRSAGFPSRID